MDEYISNILDPKTTFHKFLETKEYVPYYTEIDTDPQMEMYEDGIMEAISLYNFYSNRAIDHIINKSTDLNEIRTLESFVAECLSERNNLATLYDAQERLTESAEIEEEIYKAPFTSEYLLTEYGSLVDKSGNEFITEDYVDTLLEDGKYDTRLKRYLYEKRIRNSKEILVKYKVLKGALKGTPIKYYFPELKQYKRKSIYVDHTYYFDQFISNRDKTIAIDTQVDMYFTFLTRMLTDKPYQKEGYTNFYSIIPVMM